MSKSQPKMITVQPHTRRAPVRVAIVSTPSPIETPKPLLPCATSPMQEEGYAYRSYDQSTGTREYTDTIADRFMGPDDDGDGEY